MNERAYWPQLLDRVAEMVAEGCTKAEISYQILEEFGLPRQSFYIAVRRGDVPALKSGDPARAQARKRGETTFLGDHCVTCGSRVRYVADLRCVSCESTYNKNKAEQQENLPSEPRL